MLCCCTRHAPFLIPFKDRARVFQSVVSADREQVQINHTLHDCYCGVLKTYLPVVWSIRETNDRTGK